jgi:hypothetical protein
MVVDSELKRQKRLVFSDHRELVVVSVRDSQKIHGCLLVKNFVMKIRSVVSLRNLQKNHGCLW